MHHGVPVSRARARRSYPAQDVPSVAADPVPTRVLDLGDLQVDSVAVPHGMMPAVAYRISAGTGSITFSGDVATAHPPLAALAEDTGLLVHALALPERNVPHGDLHAKQSEVGCTARAARCAALVLTHVMPELEDERDDAERLVLEAYDGPVAWATDLATFVVGAP